MKKNAESKWRQNWNKAACKNSTCWAETLGIVLEVLDLLMWKQKVIVTVFLTLKGCQLCINYTTAEGVVLTTVTSSIKTAVTAKYLGEKCFCFAFDRIFCGFDFIISLSSQYLYVHLSNSTRGGRHVPSPMAYEQQPCWILASLAEVWELHLLVSNEKKSHLSPSIVWYT